METHYDTRAHHLPHATHGGSLWNFHRHQDVFLDDIDCDDAATFARAAEQVPSAPPQPPTARNVSCGGNCKTPEAECIGVLREHLSKAEAAVDAVDLSRRSRVNGQAKGASSQPVVPQVLFPGVQHCGGCSRSPAWDAIEVPSRWFTTQGRRDENSVIRVPTTNLSKLMNAPPTPGFVLVDTWEEKTVNKLPGTISHAATAPAWSLTNVELQCLDDGEGNAEAWAEQRLHGRGHPSSVAVGTFRYQTYLPILRCAQDDLAYQMFAIGLHRNARVLSNVMCSVELYQTAAKLLEMRDTTMASGSDTRIGGLRTSIAAATFPKIHIKGALPPKLSGYATCPTAAYNDLCDRERASGGMRNTSIFAMSLGYDRGVYGGSIAGLWALMDSAFMFDYSTGTHNLHLAEKICNTFTTIRGHDTGNSELNAHLLDMITVKACNFTALKAKAALEDQRHRLRSKPCVAIWDDLAAMSRFRLADAVFCHVWYDCPGDEASLAMVGLGCAIHDLIDIGPDISCGEISNIIPSLTGGDLSLEAIWSVYVGLVAALEWYATNDPFNPAALAILYTHWWQLDNMRHRTVTLMSRIAPSPEYAVSPEKLTSPPSFAMFTHKNGLKYEKGRTVLNIQRVELDRIEDAKFKDIQGVITKLVRPVLEFSGRRGTHLPVEATYCADVLEACLSRQHSEKIRLLWRLLLVMWKSGAMWKVVLASTQYIHQGYTNCDRHRDDYNETTWHSHHHHHPTSGSGGEAGGLKRRLSELLQLFKRQ
jgi:hypothetical protein